MFLIFYNHVPHIYNLPDSFCYICSLYMTKNEKRNIIDILNKGSLHSVFLKNSKNDSRLFVPIFLLCKLEKQFIMLTNTRVSISFAVLMVWRKQHNHDCYFLFFIVCLTKTYRYSRTTNIKLIILLFCQ